jgi:hypothetical protein
VEVPPFSSAPFSDWAVSLFVPLKHREEKQSGQPWRRLRPSQKPDTNRDRELSMLDEGVCAEVKVGSEHLRLFSEQNAQGVQASVYNVNTKKWIAPSETVESIEQGKLKAATYAQTYLKQFANLQLPLLKWKESRAA